MLEKVKNNNIFDEIFIFICAIITALGWMFNSINGMIVLVLLATFTLILLKDLKFIIPIAIFFVFTIRDGFPNNVIPIPLIIVASIFVLVLLIFTCIQGIKLKKMKSLWGLIGLAIMNLIPIFWCKTIEAGNEVFYFFFFADLGYLFIYFIFVNGIKNISLHYLATVMSYLVFILMFECLIKVIELKDTTESIFSLAYYLGWGVCNEAGIMICFSVPFIYYLLATSKSIKMIAFEFLKLLVAILGVLLTTSRGSYLALLFIVITSTILLLIKSERRRFFTYFVIVFLMLFILVALVNAKSTVAFINNILDNVFYNGLDDNGRKELWVMGFKEFTDSSLNMWLGSGICAVLEEHMSSAGFQLVPIVYHSTLVQTIVMGGIFGLLMLLLHFYEKYRNLAKTNKYFFWYMLVGYIYVDIYGMVDNTYHMFYYMIPLVISLASIDVYIYKKNL